MTYADGEKASSISQRGVEPRPPDAPHNPLLLHFRSRWATAHRCPQISEKRILRSIRSKSFADGIIVPAAKEDAALLTQGKDDDNGGGDNTAAKPDGVRLPSD